MVLKGFTGHSRNNELVLKFYFNANINIERELDFATIEKESNFQLFA